MFQKISLKMSLTTSLVLLSFLDNCYDNAFTFCNILLPFDVLIVSLATVRGRNSIETTGWILFYFVWLLVIIFNWYWATFLICTCYTKGTLCECNSRNTTEQIYLKICWIVSHCDVRYNVLTYMWIKFTIFTSLTQFMVKYWCGTWVNFILITSRLYGHIFFLLSDELLLIQFLFEKKLIFWQFWSFHCCNQ